MLLGLAAIVGCSGRAAAPAARDASVPDVAAPPAYAAGIELPAGAGRETLLARCLGCHNLGGLELFAPFYTREDWHRLLETMVAHGAVLSAAELELVADYLGLHYSPEP